MKQYNKASFYNNAAWRSLRGINCKVKLNAKSNEMISADNKVVYSFARRKKFLTTGIYSIFRGLKFFLNAANGQTAKLSFEIFILGEREKITSHIN